MRRSSPTAVDMLLLWGVVLLPSTFMMLLHAGSMAPGLLVSCVLILGVELAGHGRVRIDLTSRSPVVRWYALGVAFILIHAAFVSVLWGELSWARLLGTLVAITIALLAAANMRLRLARRSSAEVHRILGATTLMLFALAVVALTLPPIFPPVTHPLPVVVFIEPSHFAFTFLPFVGYFVVQSRGIRRWVIAIGAGALGLALGSTTLLAGLVMMLVTCLPWWQSVVACAICGAAAVAAGFDASFIVNRIVFNDSLPNLSNLVLLQGWERAWLAMDLTEGLGLGFQQFGVWGPMGDVQEIIYAMGGEYLNLYDGGTTASKVVGEFGVFGITLLIGFLYAWSRLASSLRRALSGPRRSALGVFIDIVIIAIAVELFVRGVGYMSMGLFLLGLRYAGSNLAATAPISHYHRPPGPTFLVRLRRELARQATSIR